VLSGTWRSLLPAKHQEMLKTSPTNLHRDCINNLKAIKNKSEK